MPLLILLQEKFALGKYKLTLTFAFSLDLNGNGHPRHEFCSSRVDDEIRGGISVKLNLLLLLSPCNPPMEYYGT